MLVITNDDVTVLVENELEEDQEVVYGTTITGIDLTVSEIDATAIRLAKATI